MPSSAAKVHRSPADTPGAQDQGLGQHREGVLGGSEGEPVRRAAPTCSIALRGHNELLAAPTCAVLAQAAQLGHHGSVRRLVSGPPMSSEKKLVEPPQPGGRDREASSAEAIVDQKSVRTGFSENDEGPHRFQVTLRLVLRVLHRPRSVCSRWAIRLRTATPRHRLPRVHGGGCDRQQQSRQCP